MHTGPAPVGRHVAALADVDVDGLCVAPSDGRGTARGNALGAGVRARRLVTPPDAAGPATRNGTVITFHAGLDIFETAECSFAGLAERFGELAFLNQGLGISLTDGCTPGESPAVRFQFPGGPRGFVAFLDSQAGVPVHPDIIGVRREDHRMVGTMEVAFSVVRLPRGTDEVVQDAVTSLWGNSAGQHVRVRRLPCGGYPPGCPRQGVAEGRGQLGMREGVSGGSGQGPGVRWRLRLGGGGGVW